MPATSPCRHHAHTQIFDFFDTDRTGSVNGKNVERMLFLVRVHPRVAFAVSAPLTAGYWHVHCTPQLGYIVEQNAIKPNRLYTLDGALATRRVHSAILSPHPT